MKVYGSDCSRSCLTASKPYELSSIRLLPSRMTPSYANRTGLRRGGCLTRPDEAPVAMTVLALLDISFLKVMESIDHSPKKNIHCT